MIQTLMRIAFQEAKAYKVIIDAKEKMVPIYEKVKIVFCYKNKYFSIVAF